MSISEPPFVEGELLDEKLPMIFFSTLMISVAPREPFCELLVSDLTIDQILSRFKPDVVFAIVEMFNVFAVLSYVSHCKEFSKVRCTFLLFAIRRRLGLRGF